MMRTFARCAIVAAVIAVRATPAVAQTDSPDTAQVALQGNDVSFDGRLTFSGRGFAGGEPTSVTVEDDQGQVQAHLEPVHVESDGQVYMISVPVPPGLAPGAHTLRVTGATSGHFGRAPFTLRWQTPTVHLDVYTGKPTHSLSFSGAGFVPNEPVDVVLGQQPLTTVTADTFGAIAREGIGIPSLDAGDYTVSFVGHTSQIPVSIGFNIQGFHPWVVLHNYYVSQQAGVGFTGEDFIPGEAVVVYLNTRASDPVAQVTADGDGKIAMESALSAANLAGDNRLIFVGQQSQTELTTTFTVASP